MSSDTIPQGHQVRVVAEQGLVLHVGTLKTTVAHHITEHHLVTHKVLTVSNSFLQEWKNSTTGFHVSVLQFGHKRSSLLVRTLS